MGRKDIITKEYMEDTEVFADVFNHMIYKGEKVIDPKNLKELDTVNVIIPYGADGAEVPYQKYRIEKEVKEEKVNVCKAIQGIEERGRAAGRSEGIQIGAEYEQRLTKSLLKDNRIDDLKRALDDPAFRQKLLEEYGID